MPISGIKSRYIIATFVHTTILLIYLWIVHPNRAKSLVSALSENKAGAISANQNAGLQSKINSANQGVVESTCFAHWECTSFKITNADMFRVGKNKQLNCDNKEM